MSDQLLKAYVWQQTMRSAVTGRIIKDEAGEGVISAAIAVLIMAFIGVGLYTIFKLTMGEAGNAVHDKVKSISDSNPNG